MKRNICFFTLILLFSQVNAQFSMEAQLRPRAEFRDGYRLLPAEDSKPAGQVNQRTRLTLNYKHEDRISAGISIQDLRIWGQDPQMTTEPSFGLYEAWVGLQFTDQISIKAGRQELRYDNQRLLAINDWALTGRTHDALLFQYVSAGPAKTRLHIGSAFNQSHNRLFGTDYEVNNYKILNFIWFNTNLSSSTNTSLLAIADGYQHPNKPEELNVRFTWSGFLTYQTGALQLRLNPAYQHGKTVTGQGISAFYFMTEADYSFTGRIRSTLGIELFSGNDAGDPGDKFNAFSDLYGVGHGRNGFMDYFTSFPAHTNNAGLINPFIRNNFRLSEQWLLSADLHLFFLQNNYIHQGEIVDNYLGTEIDFTLNYSFNSFTRIIMGYSMMFGTESMEAIKGGSKDELAHWAFVMIRMTPKFL
ncbi:MAG: alginate export family protein [Bacteroidales bacterium]|nr:alginate export family protein [Bacteroidales bacterium]